MQEIEFQAPSMGAILAYIIMFQTLSAAKLGRMAGETLELFNILKQQKVKGEACQSTQHKNPLP